MDHDALLTPAQAPVNVVLVTRPVTDAAPATPLPAFNMGSHVFGDVTIEYRTIHVGQ